MEVVLSLWNYFKMGICLLKNMGARALILAASLLMCVSLFAQENEKKETYRYANITEFGLLTAGLKGVAPEATTAHGISVNKQHYFGLGFGIGLCQTRYDESAYMPIFLNYRFYFKPEKTFSPHVNVSLGGIAMEEGRGLYSSVTMGFKAGIFSFSSGLSFTPIYYKEKTKKDVSLFGITLKCGFSF